MSEADLQLLDPSLCPLCGKANHCVMAKPDAAARAAPCWCVKENFPAELLARLPEASHNRACICRACVQAFTGNGNA